MEIAWTSTPSYGFRPFVRNLLIKLDKICQPTRGLHCIHATAIANEGEDLAFRAGESSANRHRHAIANGTTHILQPVVRRCTSGEGVETTARRYGFIDHDGLFRDHIPEERRNL